LAVWLHAAPSYRKQYFAGGRRAMAKGQLQTVLEHIYHVAGPGAGRDDTDRRLLQRFARLRDESAFSLLVQRHGPLVWGVCWRVLQQVQDAEDAFQATFLILASRAGAVRWHDSVANWLYEAAHRLAHEIKTRNARRSRHEQQAAAMANLETAGCPLVTGSRSCSAISKAARAPRRPGNWAGRCARSSAGSNRRAACCAPGSLGAGWLCLPAASP
jgi:RNA polymerase sigma factor (sigma-70 family)